MARGATCRSQRSVSLTPCSAPTSLISTEVFLLPAFSTTLRTLAQQAWPVLISQWAAIAYGVLDTAMTGHAHPNDLAAMSLSVSIYLTVFVGLLGITYALIPILAHDYGAGRYSEIGFMWGQGVWLALVLSVMGAMVLLFPDPWLNLSGNITPEVRAITQSYLQILACTLPSVLLFRTIYVFCAAISRTKGIMLINLGSVAFKAFFNWLFIYGHWGFPALGAIGAGLSSALACWLSLGAAFWLVKSDPFYKTFSLRLSKPCWAAQKQLLRLGLPMGASYLVEVCTFTFMALFIAQEGVYILGGHQILASIVEVCYMVPVAVGVATAALTAQALGAGQYTLARHTGGAGLTLGLMSTTLTITVVWNAAPLLLKVYTDNAQVAGKMLSLLPILPFFQLFDSLQCIISYLLRAYKIVVTPLLIQSIALGGFGLAGGWWLGFGPQAGGIDVLRVFLMPHSPRGAGTMWLMALLGLGLATLSLHYWYWKIQRSPRFVVSNEVVLD